MEIKREKKLGMNSPENYDNTFIMQCRFKLFIINEEPGQG